jgi:transposase
MDDMGVLPTFTGTAIHDAFAPYNRYTGATHSLCNAHLLRELAAVTEHHEQRGHTPGPDNWCWADQVTDALLIVETAVDHAKESGSDAIGADVLATQTQLIRHCALITGEHHPDQQGRTEAPGTRPADPQTRRRLPTLRHRLRRMFR